jgi:UDPglucose--hexose-1-phosphate uridylyltransferase
VNDAPRILTDPATGRPILMAPHRRNQPRHTAAGADGADVCPFCPGAEQQTPPEVDAVRPPETTADTPGWRVRAFPNLYPAAEHHEVIAEGAEHEVQPARLDPALWSDALALWRRRLAAIEQRPGVRCAYLFKNVGQRAGASIAHNHSQILGLPLLPPRLELELAQARAGGCLQCAELETAAADGRIVVDGAHHVALAPRQPKLPFETWLVPRRHGADFAQPDAAADLARVLQALFAAVDAAFAAPPFNVWLHRIPGADFHWHFELQPRTGYLAGLELGADMYINAIGGAEGAARLRTGLRG